MRSGAYRLVSGQLDTEGLTVDTSALGEVETSWALVDDGEEQVLELVVTGAGALEGEVCVEDADCESMACHADVCAAPCDSAAECSGEQVCDEALAICVAPPEEEPPPRAPTPPATPDDASANAQGGCGVGGTLARPWWGWLGFLVLVSVQRARRRRRSAWAG